MPGWRVFLLDSNCEYIGGCGPKSPEGKWLAKELKKSSETCAIAAWHHPLHTSGGYNGDQATIDRALPLWTAVDAGGVDIVLNGHDHIYDRFAPIGGVTEFVVGTGGKELYEIGPPAPKSKVAFDDRTGVLRLTLRSDQRFDYSFIDASNDKVVDSGSQRCINNPSH
jgi:3',5'-cyclic AMP phosphodiesterase CpdA